MLHTIDEAISFQYALVLTSWNYTLLAITTSNKYGHSGYHYYVYLWYIVTGHYGTVWDAIPVKISYYVCFT